MAHPVGLVRSSPRALAFWTLLAAYIALTICVLVWSPVLTLDETLAGLHLKMQHPAYRPWINHYVIFGQRGPVTLGLLPVFVWLAWRRRSKRPLVLLGTALILLNVTVGVVKYAIGRVGPMHVGDSDVHEIFAGANIYPSGHVSNAVVMYGLVAWVVAPRFRKAVVAAAVFLSVTVGLATVYLRTHWFSDVLGGWLAGGLVLLSLPTVLPFAERATDRVLDALRDRYARWRATSYTPKHLPRAVAQRTSIPVRAQSHNRAAVAVSPERIEEPTRVG
jgi:membrane-associated phospholipid phosphatase